MTPTNEFVHICAKIINNFHMDFVTNPPLIPLNWKEWDNNINFFPKFF